MDIPENLKDIESFDVRHSPIISAFCDKIGLSSTVDNALESQMEISSNYWENMCSYLKEKDVTPILLNPYQVKKYRQAMGLKIKTDPIDATAIAGLICGRKYESLYISDDSMMELKELVRIKYSF